MNTIMTVACRPLKQNEGFRMFNNQIDIREQKIKNKIAEMFFGGKI